MSSSSFLVLKAWFVGQNHFHGLKPLQRVQTSFLRAQIFKVQMIIFRTQTHRSGSRFPFLQIQNVLLECNPIFFRAPNIICGSRTSFLCYYVLNPNGSGFFTGAKTHYRDTFPIQNLIFTIQSLVFNQNPILRAQSLILRGPRQKSGCKTSFFRPSAHFEGLILINVGLMELHISMEL